MKFLLFAAAALAQAIVLNDAIDTNVKVLTVGNYVQDIGVTGEGPAYFVRIPQFSSELRDTVDDFISDVNAGPKLNATETLRTCVYFRDRLGKSVAYETGQWIAKRSAVPENLIGIAEALLAAEAESFKNLTAALTAKTTDTNKACSLKTALAGINKNYADAVAAY